jgi:hypothetical protein
MTAAVLTPMGENSPLLSIKREDAPPDSGALVVRYSDVQAIVPGNSSAVLLKYRVRILNDQLDWGGGGCTEWTARVGVKVSLLDSTTQSLNSIHNTGTKNCTASGNKVWVYQQLVLNEWTDVEVDITTELVTAGFTSSISSVDFIEVGSNGWNFEAEFDDIRVEYAE